MIESVMAANHTIEMDFAQIFEDYTISKPNNIAAVIDSSPYNDIENYASKIFDSGEAWQKYPPLASAPLKSKPEQTDRFDHFTRLRAKDPIQINQSQARSNKSPCRQSQAGNLATVTVSSLQNVRESHSRGMKEAELEKMKTEVCSVRISHNFGAAEVIEKHTSKDRRRERNKVLARKTRIKKKEEVQLLQESVVSLVNENKKLKLVAKKHLPQHVSHQMLSACKLQLPDNINQLVHQVMSRSDRNLIYDLKSQQRSFCIVNAAAPDMPIVYASSAFCELTGYEVQEVVGKNFLFLQGPATDRNEVAKVKDALMAGEDMESVLLNYRKNGKHFWNKLELRHLLDSNCKSSALIVGIQYEVHPSMNGSGKMTRYPSLCSTGSNGSGSGGRSFASMENQLTLLVRGNTSLSANFPSSEYEYRSTGTGNTDGTSSDGGSTSDPFDRRF